MNDSDIIYNFISVSIPDDHPVVYQYVMGRNKSKTSAVEQGLRLADGILSPPYSLGHIRTILKRYLKEKEELYKKGEIKIKPIY